MFQVQISFCAIDAEHLGCYNGELMYEGWNFNSGNYLFKTDTK